MPNQITASGLQTASQAELLAQFTAAMQTIYGTDIDLSSNTPDGQWVNNIIQLALDLEDLLTSIYNGFNPDNAIGTVLDQRVAINGIQRQAGTYTVINILIKTSQSVNLQGLDLYPNAPFTVADASGNQYELQTTVTGFNPGTGGQALAFQAANPGALNPTQNTVNVPVTIVLGVSSVNNPTLATSVGLNEETDAALKVRRQQSVSLASQGYLAGLLAALENISGVTAAFVYENNTNATNGDGVPGHSIWVIVAGTAAAESIANAIYTKRNAGCGMFGTTTYVITQINGTLFTVAWSTVVQENLFIKFNVLSINGTGVPNIAAIKAGLPLSLVPGVFAEVNINELATQVQILDPNSLVVNAGFDVSAGGSFANQILSPAAKNKQFFLQASNIIILPMVCVAAGGQLSVSGASILSTASVVHPNTIQFSELGGYTGGTITYSMVSGAGSINSSTGLYTSATPGTDVVQVADSLGNSAICTITVT